MSVKLVRLLNGEDLIADVSQTSPIPSSISLKNPVRIVVMPNKLDPKTPNIGLAPWSEFSSDKTFEIDKSHVLCIMEPIDDFRNNYNSMFSGIVKPPSGLILP